MIRLKRPLIQRSTPLQDIPTQWLTYIEPKILVDKLCWLWTGGVDRHGEPLINLYNPNTGKRNNVRVKRFIASMFWVSIDTRNDIVHVCGNVVCLNPNHFYISPAHWQQEDRQKMIEEKIKELKCTRR